jgi:tetratricopeptide (TPR) repeat protein
MSRVTESRLARLLAFPLVVCSLSWTVKAPAEEHFVVRVVDPTGTAVPGIQIVHQGVTSPPTTDGGLTETRTPFRDGEVAPEGSAVELSLPPSTQATWFLITNTVQVPGPGQPAAEVVVMKRADWVRLTVDYNEACALRGAEELPAEERREILLEEAKKYGLDEYGLMQAIGAVAEDVQDPVLKGIAHYLAGEHAEAESILRSALEDAEAPEAGSDRIPKRAEEALVKSAQYLGHILCDQGRYQEAVTAFRKGLEFRENDPTLQFWLGLALSKSAEWSRAEPLLRRALQSREDSYGPEHLMVAVPLSGLAQVLQATNRLGEAEPLMRRALRILEKTYGPKHPMFAIGLNNLARLLHDAGRLAEAEPLMRQALQIDEDNYGPEHPSVARDLNNLTLLLQDTNRLTEAEPLMRRALRIVENTYGPEHPKLANALNNLALLLRATDRLTEAEPLMRRSLRIVENTYGPEHPTVAIHLNNLATLLLDSGRLAEAEPPVRRALDILEKSHGPQHPQVASALSNLAALLIGSDRLAEAEPLLRRALQIDEDSYGPQHPKVALRLNNLARLLQATHRWAEAEPLLRRALKIAEVSLPADHPWTIRIRENLEHNEK